MAAASVPPPAYALPDGYEHVYSGKVRDLYRTPEGRLLFVASDRISAYDWVLETPIPDKGRVLTQLSLWWFERLERLVPNHVRSTVVPVAVEGRAMVCEDLTMFPVECVARGYLTGSGLTEYAQNASVCGVNLPPGLVDGSKLPKTIFTPATKAALGDHDENVTFDHVVATVGQDEAATLRRLTVAAYDAAAAIALDRGLVLADTKFEFGERADRTVVLADEALTPDSSRYWDAASWSPGGPQPSYDKQYVRDWLTSSGWDRHGGEPPPPLPDDVVERTRAKYVDAYERLTGRRFT